MKTKFQKIIKDYLIKLVWVQVNLTPKGLYELSEYCRNFGAITFEFHNNEDGSITAISKNFKLGSIITEGANIKELDENIKDAILTSFDIPSSFAKEAKITKVGSSEDKQYALA